MRSAAARAATRRGLRRITVPVHHEDYTVFRSPLSDFLDACRRRDAPTQVRTVGRGETVSLRVA